MANNYRQHEPLRIPQTWGEAGRSFIIQLERILDSLFNLIGAAREKLDAALGRIERLEEEPQYIAFGDNTKTIAQNLTGSWTTAIPNDGKPHLVRVYASNTYYFGFISRYSNNYGSAYLSMYNGYAYNYYLNNGTVTEAGLGRLQNISYYLESAGTQTFSLTSTYAYLLTVDRLNTTDTGRQGLYLVQCYHTNSCVRAIASSSIATVSVSGRTLTVTTSDSYVWLSVTRV